MTTAGRRREQTLARVYAAVTGASVVLIGIVGLLLGNESLFGVLNIDLAEDAIHLLSGVRCWLPACSLSRSGS
jgi:hypothetical protein